MMMMMMMSDHSEHQDSDPRPRVTGYFVEDPEGIPLSVAIGRAVVGAGSLEAALRLEAARLLHAQLAAGGADPDSTLPEELSKLDNLTSGGLLQKLRKLGLPEELDKRIADAVDRRNDLVHRTFEEPELARAIGGEGDIDAVVKRIERLALDCGELAVELEMFAIPKLLEMTGASASALIDLIKAIDPSTITDPRERKQLEAVQAFASLEHVSVVLKEIGIEESPYPVNGHFGETRH
jgi:hypothetical protein